MGPIKALKASAEATMGAKWDITGLWLVTGLLQIAGFLCLIIGLAFTSAIFWVAFAFAYQKLVGQTTFTEDLKPSLEKQM
jgi:hypothetical protein